MRDGVQKVFQWFGFGFVFLFALYTAGYLFTVRKTVSRSGAKQIPGGSREAYINSANLGGPVTTRLFSPALKIDRRYIRRRYWADWYVVIDGGKTNIIFPDDFSPEEARQRLKL